MINEVKKVAAIHDMSGLGRCSLTAAIPILSVLGIQPAPFPTAILSSQTGYSDFSFLDLTEEMKNYKNSWSKNEFNFNGVYSGFLGSDKQIDIVREFILEQKNALIVVDPVMGDNGEVYKTYSTEMCEKMRSLVSLAHIVTPNLTEGCLLTNREFKKQSLDDKDLLSLAKDISKLGPSKVIITGIIKGTIVKNFAYDKEQDSHFSFSTAYDDKSYSGTGDIFASIVCGLLIRDFSFQFAIEKATEFIYNAIKLTNNYNVDAKNGIIFEPLLKLLFLD